MRPGGVRPTDWLLLRSLRVAGALSVGIVALILGFLLLESIPALREVGPLRFLTDDGWLPKEGRPEEGNFSLLPMAAATVTTTLGAVFLAAPAGILAAIFCHFYAPSHVAFVFRRLVELLAGIPSVVYGFWGLVTIVPLVNALQPPGPSLFAGILILGMMILPTIALLADAALQALPATHLQGAAALGLSRWRTVRGVVLPATRPGLMIAIVLGTMRAIGETMAVLMVCGNVAQVPTSLFAPVRTLTANIALELGYATAGHRAVLFASGLFLMLLILGLVALQESLKRRSQLA